LEILRDGPHEFLLELAHRYGHAVRYPVGPFRFFQFTDPAAVQHVLVTNHGKYGRRTFQYDLLAEVTGDGLLTMDGRPWRTRRRLAQPSFHRGRVTEFAPTFTAYAEQMARRWDDHARSGEPIDVAAEMMHVALQAVVRTLFNAEVSDRADVLWRATLDVLHHLMFRARTFGMIPGWLPTRRNRQFAASLTVLDETIYTTIRERRKSGAATDAGTPDLLQRLMDAEDKETGVRLSDRQLRDEMITLLIAGHETVASALTWTWHLLGTHPDADEQLATELRDVLGDEPAGADTLEHLAFTVAVFHEALRLYPPAWVITRRALAEDSVNGLRVPRGALVVLSPYVTQRHPDFWPEPTRFDPDRFTRDHDGDRHRYAYFPFGGGPHLCIGNHFSIVEATVLIATIGRRYRLEPLAAERAVVDPGVTLQPRGGLPMRVKRR
jgi:cytochrome P450